jgi:hypothetical protein
MKIPTAQQAKDSAKALDRALDEARLASDKLENMRVTSNIRALAQLWSEFLTHLQRSFTKLKIATTNTSAKGWYDTVENIRKTDELLSYVRHARNADEHGVERITDQKPAHVTINPKQGKDLIVDHLQVGPHGVRMGPKLAEQAKVEFHPESITLVSVRDRGSIYQPPKSHLGKELHQCTPVSVADLALTFVKHILDEAQARMAK